jgi:predicted DNA binding protein
MTCSFTISTKPSKQMTVKNVPNLIDEYIAEYVNDSRNFKKNVRNASNALTETQEKLLTKAYHIKLLK